MPTYLMAAFFAVVVVADLQSRGWKPDWPRRMIIGHLVTTILFLVNVWTGAASMALVAGFQSLFDSLSLPHVPVSFWDSTPHLLMIPVILLMRDFTDYWTHRALHSNLLWPIHAIHHSDPDVTASTTFRVHMLETPFMLMGYTIVFGLLGAPVFDLGIVVGLLLIQNCYCHINVDWTHGPFRYLLASPRFHRWHHANIPEGRSGVNLAAVFPFWDVFFGTYYVPGPCTAEVGADGVPENNVVWLIFFPFIEWFGMARRLVAPERA